MESHWPSTLQEGDSISVIAPSDSFKTISAIGAVSAGRLEKEFGISVTYGEHCTDDPDALGSYSIESRVSDLHAAFKNTSVRAIICATGGFNANDLLPYIDWEIIKANPKPLIGSSDLTVLLNAIYAKTGVKTYHGPNFFRFGMKIGLEYTLQYFRSALFSTEPYTISPSAKWSEDKWYRDQDNRVFNRNDGYIVVNPGSAEGIILGGSLCSFNLVQGTEYMPKLKDSILFIEDDALAGDLTFGEFYRNLQSLLQQPDGDSIRGIIIGRFYSACQMDEEKIRFIMKASPRLQHVPIIANVDFGHTDPALTLPIGGAAAIFATNDKVEIKILDR